MNINSPNLRPYVGSRPGNIQGNPDLGGFTSYQHIAGIAFENTIGGWLPNGAEPVGSIIAENLSERQRLRQEGDIKSADTIRRVVTGRNVIVQDTPDGTLWFFKKTIP